MRDVEAAVTQLESSTSEKHLDPSAVSRGSSLERDNNGLLTLAGGKITDYRKMAEGAMERVVDILRAEFDRNFKLINSKTYPCFRWRAQSSKCGFEIEAFAQLGVSRGLDSKEAFILQTFTDQMLLKSLASLHTAHKHQVSAWRDTCHLHYAMRNELALSPVDFLLR